MSESGDRAAFVGRLRARLAGGVPTNLAHPAPAPSPTAPELRYANLGIDLIETFGRVLVSAAGVLHRVEGDEVPAELLERLLPSLDAPTAVVSAEPEARAVGRTLESLGVEVSPYSPAAGAAAALGVTSAVTAIAATGSVVVDASVAGGRGASLLPTVHLCVLGASRLVATPADVLRQLTGHPERLPSNLVLISGPSRTGDIEQIITLGVHGPTAVHVVLLEGA
jgi:L-lactate dehydrogenase complex protein LldG